MSETGSTMAARTPLTIMLDPRPTTTATGTKTETIAKLRIPARNGGVAPSHTS